MEEGFQKYKNGNKNFRQALVMRDLLGDSRDRRYVLAERFHENMKAGAS